MAQDGPRSLPAQRLSALPGRFAYGLPDAGYTPVPLLVQIPRGSERIAVARQGAARLGRSAKKCSAVEEVLDEARRATKAIEVMAVEPCCVTAAASRY